MSVTQHELLGNEVNNHFLDKLQDMLQERYGNDWYYKWDFDDGYMSVILYVPMEIDDSMGYTIHSYGGDSNDCIS